MPKNRRSYTFLIIPTATSTVRRLNIPVNYFYVIGVTLAALVVFSLLGALRWGKAEADHLRYQSVAEENSRLKSENDVYQKTYSKMKGQLSFIQDESKQLARQAKMEPVTDVDKLVGAGGPETVAAMERQADLLEHQVRLIGDQLRTDQLRIASMPGGLPVQGYITDGFGIRRNPFGGEGGREFHEGLDIAVAFGTPVSCTADGLVVWAAPYSGYGNLVVVYHSNGVTSRYGHMSKLAVEPGQRIKRGEQVGYAGSTGRSTGVHVHYEIRENDQPVDPRHYIQETHYQ
jgi:murein DD-endopeptidase MepM/ murein hydrolase activator NlpD